MIGRRETFVMTPINRLYNGGQAVKFIFAPRWIHHLLKKNAIYYNSHIGETCYIMGNGPSLKQMGDLSVLHDRFVITVNTIMRSPIFSQVNTNFHILMDPDFFNGKASKEDIESFSKLNGVDLLVPYKYYDSAKAIWPDSPIWCCYNSFIPMKGSMHVDFTKPIYSFNNVLHWAVLWAIYLGFSKIVLLGADMTGFMELYNKRNNISSHVYEYSDKERVINCSTNNEWYLKAYGQTLEFFGILGDIAQNNNTIILNATPRSFLDMFPMVDLSESI